VCSGQNGFPGERRAVRARVRAETRKTEEGGIASKMHVFDIYKGRARETEERVRALARARNHTCTDAFASSRTRAQRKRSRTMSASTRADACTHAREHTPRRHKHARTYACAPICACAHICACAYVRARGRVHARVRTRAHVLGKATARRAERVRAARPLHPSRRRPPRALSLVRAGGDMILPNATLLSIRQRALDSARALAARRALRGGNDCPHGPLCAERAQRGYARAGARRHCAEARGAEPLRHPRSR
jgi:hypothetical protein